MISQHFDKDFKSRQSKIRPVACLENYSKAGT